MRVVGRGNVPRGFRFRSPRDFRGLHSLALFFGFNLGMGARGYLVHMDFGAGTNSYVGLLYILNHYFGI